MAGSTAFDTLARVERFPDAEEAVKARRIEASAGGCGANVARGLARLGHQPQLLSAVGEDFEGSPAEASLLDEGVILEHLVRVAEEPTAAAMMATDDALEQTIIYDEGATPHMRQLSPVETELGHFAPGEITAYPDLMQAVDRVVFDPGQEVFYRPAEEILEPLEHVDVLLVNEHEAGELAQAVGGLEELAGDREALVVTHRAGQRIHQGGEVTEVEAFPADVVDPTGAGDALAVGLVHALAAGKPLAEACCFGGAVAACVIEHVGAQRGLPTVDEATERLQREQKA